MHYKLYCSSGNSHGVEEYVSYFEIDDSGYSVRYIEVKADGSAFRYSTDHPADGYGVLPEGVWNEPEASKNEHGTVVSISAELFEAVWSTTVCANVP